MKKTPLLTSAIVLAAIAQVYATDATVSWTTLVMAKQCPGNAQHGPRNPETANFSSTTRTDTWHVAGTNEPPAQPGEIVFTPDNISVESWTDVGEGFLYANLTNQYSSSMQFILVETLRYPPGCCYHTGYVCMVIKDIAVFSGGGAGLPMATNISTYNFQMSESRNHKDHPFFYVVHEIDDFNLRYSTVYQASPGAEYGCGVLKQNIKMSTNNTPEKLEIRGGATNETGGIFINYSVPSSTNWFFVSNFVHDANGDADINLTGFAWSTNSGFVAITNAP